jgi:hypothetical protein
MFVEVNLTDKICALPYSEPQELVNRQVFEPTAGEKRQRESGLLLNKAKILLFHISAGSKKWQ